MTALENVLSFVDSMNDWIGKVTCIGALIISFLVLIEVILRYAFNSPTVWTNELSQMIFGVYVVLAGGPVQRWGGHVNVDVITSKFSKKTQTILELVLFPFFLIFCLMLLIYGGELALESLRNAELSDSAWGPPVYPVKLMIPFGALIVLLQGSAKFIRGLLSLTRSGLNGVETKRSAGYEH